MTKNACKICTTVSKTLELLTKLPTSIVFLSQIPRLPRVETRKDILQSHNLVVEKLTRETRAIRATRVTVVVDRLALDQVDLDLELQVVDLPLKVALPEQVALDTVY